MQLWYSTTLLKIKKNTHRMKWIKTNTANTIREYRKNEERKKSHRKSSERKSEQYTGENLSFVSSMLFILLAFFHNFILTLTNRVEVV